MEEVKNAVIGNRNVTWFDIRVNDANATIPPDFSCAFSKDAFAKAKVKKDDSSGKVKVIVDSGLIMRLKVCRRIGGLTLFLFFYFRIFVNASQSSAVKP